MTREALPEYHIMPQLGSGALAKVHKLKRKSDAEMFAAKIVDRSLLRDKELSHINEYINHLKVNAHQNILTLHLRRQDDRYIYYVMDYIPGGDLYTIRTKISIEKVRDYIHQVAAALAYCHERKIIHNDVKLENVLISTDHKCVYLADFGYSVAPGQDYRICGTIDYYCPYKAEGVRYDNKTDIWALGIMYHELICGHTPFEKDTVVNTLLSIQMDPFVPTVKILQQDAQLITKMLDKNSTTRPTANEIVSMLSPVATQN